MIGKPIMEVVLEPGDVLYMPRGTIHQVGLAIRMGYLYYESGRITIMRLARGMLSRPLSHVKRGVILWRVLVLIPCCVGPAGDGADGQ